MDKIETAIMNNKSNQNDIQNDLVELVDNITSSIKIYLNIIKAYNLKLATNFEKEKLKSCAIEMVHFIDNGSILSSKNLFSERCYQVFE